MFAPVIPGFVRPANIAPAASATLCSYLNEQLAMSLLTLPLLFAAALNVAGPGGDTLQTQIAAADTALFSAAFTECNPAKAAALTTPDLEFFHDKDGKSASSRRDFQASLERVCAHTEGGAWSMRRELVPGSLQVFPMHDDRALEMGDHHFYERSGQAAERRTGGGRFIILWRKVDGAWLMERVISYDHTAATP